MPEITPQALAIRRRELATDYNKNMKELADIKKRKAFAIIELLDKHKTSSRAEAYYAITEDGQKCIELEYHSRGLLELMRAVKSEIEIKQSEAFNNY